MYSFTRDPVLEKKRSEEIPVTYRGGTGWRYWSLLAAQGYKEAYPKSVHGCQPKKNPREMRRTSQLASLHPHVIAMDAGPNVWTWAPQNSMGSLTLLPWLYRRAGHTSCCSSVWWHQGVNENYRCKFSFQWNHLPLWRSGTGMCCLVDRALQQYFPQVHMFIILQRVKQSHSPELRHICYF